MTIISRLLFIFVTVVTTMAAFAATPSPVGAKLYIISPANGELVQTPVTIKFGLHGMGVAPAGIDSPNTGHHHLMIDVKKLPPMNKPLPSDQKHRHFGGGQTQTTIMLLPGEHTLQLILADKNHVPHNPPVLSEKISITVK